MIHPAGQDTRQVSRVRGRRQRQSVAGQRVRIGAPDPTLTPHAGLIAITELADHLGVATAVDAGIGPVKLRDRGLTGGQLLLSLASCQLAGGDHLVSLDRLRADRAGQELTSIPTPASTTAAGLARRFTPEQITGIEAGIAVLCQRVLAAVGQVRRTTDVRQSW